MVLVNGQWENIQSVSGISDIIRTHFSESLADELDDLIDCNKEALLIENNDLKSEIVDLYDENYDVISENNDLQRRVNELENEIKEYQNQINVIRAKNDDM